MAIYRGEGGSVEGITESNILVVTVAQGGTGATTASGARTNLGLGTAATTNSTDYATAAQGTLADSAVQPADIGTAAAEDVGYFATAAQGTLADSATQPGDLATVATTGAYSDLTGKPTVPTNLDSLTDVVITSASTDQVLKFNGTNWVNSSASGGGTGTVTSVDMSVPTGLAVSGNPVTTAGTLAVTYASGYAIPTTAKQTEWDTAYTDRNKWDGGATGLTAATGRTSLGLGTAATTAATDYATAAQGTNADTAYGWGNHASAGYVSYTSGSTSALTVAVGTTAQRPGSPANGMIRYNTTESFYEVYKGTDWEKINTTPLSVNADFLVIAGGGGGGGFGGGGAGGYRELTSQSLNPATNYTVTVGAGGAGAVNGNVKGSTGSNSVFNTTTSNGGGGGGAFSTTYATGDAGGSGGGGGTDSSSPYTGRAGGAGNTPSTSPSQGNTGGTGATGATAGGGGGGASAVGANASSGVGGNGGAGTASSITGTSVTRAGGGGGGASSTGGTGVNGGGNGATGSGSGAAGTANTGGGGGGGYAAASAAGGSGVVIVKYPDTFTISNSGGGLTYSTTTSGSFKITTFTAGTGNIQFN